MTATFEKIIQVGLLMEKLRRLYAGYPSDEKDCKGEIKITKHLVSNEYCDVILKWGGARSWAIEKLKSLYDDDDEICRLWKIILDNDKRARDIMRDMLATMPSALFYLSNDFDDDKKEPVKEEKKESVKEEKKELIVNSKESSEKQHNNTLDDIKKDKGENDEQKNETHIKCRKRNIKAKVSVIKNKKIVL